MTYIAKEPGVARGKKFKIFFLNETLKKNSNLFEPITPPPPMSVHKKFRPNRSSRMAGYTQHILTNSFLVLYTVNPK